MNIIKWIIGVLFLFKSIDSMGYGGWGLIASSIFLIIGFLCIPPTSKKIWTILRLNSNKPAKYIIVIILWLTGTYVYTKMITPSLNLNTNTKNNIESIKTKNNNIKLDSTIYSIKNDKDNKVESIKVLADSTLKIDISNEKEGITAIGVENLYEVLKYGTIQEIEVYFNDQICSSYGYRSSKIYDEFENEFISSYDGSCRIVESAIKREMNDPDSYKHKSTFIRQLVNKEFEITTVFYGKNIFGSTILNKARAIVLNNGDLKSLEYVK